MKLDFRTTRRTAWLVFCLLLSTTPALAQNPNVTIDDQPTAEQRLEEVRALRQAGRLDEALELMQELIEGSRFKLVGLGDGKYADIERWCWDRLLRDRELQEAYRQRFTASATRALEQARLLESAPSADPGVALADVYRRFSVTRPGMEAGLRAAGWLLESGDADSARTLIDELQRHPDHKQSLAQWSALNGAAGAYVRDRDRVVDAAEQLRELGKAQRAEALMKLAGSIQPGVGGGGRAPRDTQPKPEELKVSLWDQPLAELESAPKWKIADALVRPVLTPTQVLMNNGRQIVALDRASGQRAWVYPSDDADAVSRPATGQRWYDTRSVGVGGNAVAAVLGECFGITENRNPYVPPNKLVCMDPQTGELLWTRVSGQLRETEPTEVEDRRVGRVNLQHTHFLGTPIVTRGKVLVMLRRANSQGTQSVWLLAYDQQTSDLLWYRHLALASLSYSRDLTRITPQISLVGETVYISDSVATVGAIDVHTGGYRWLKVLPVGFGRSQRLTIQARGALAPPVLTNAGLLVSLALVREPMVLLDPDDGSLLQDFKADPVLSTARYLLDAEGGAVIVGETSISFWDAGDAAIAWTFALNPAELAQGHGDTGQNYVVVPTNQRLVVLELQTGKLLEEADPIGSSIIARDGELFAVNEGRVYSYTRWERVQQRLVKRVEESPLDPSAGLALASLALRQDGRTPAVLKGVDYALRAVSRQPGERVGPIRKRVFDQLRELSLKANDPALKPVLLDHMARVTQTAEQEAAYHLDMGVFLVLQGQPRRAVDHFHAVIADPAFASQPYTLDGVARPAGIVAKQRIGQLIEQHGRAIYARQDAMANAWLQDLKAADGIDAAALTSVARRYPLSLAAVRVLIEAAGARDAEGRTIDAAGLYQQAVARAMTRDQLASASGSLLGFYIKRNQPGPARTLLLRLAKRSPDIEPLDGQKPIALRQWQGRVDQLEVAAKRRSALSASLGQPFTLDGRVVGPLPGRDSEISPGRLYLQHEDGTLSRHDADDPKNPAWSVALPPKAKQLYILEDHPEQLLLWSSDSETTFALSPATGQRLWSTRLRLDSKPAKLEPNAAPRIQLPGLQVLVTVSDTVVCFGHRLSGEVVAVDRAAGSVLWKTSLDMNRVTAISADSWTLAVAGRAGQPGQLRSGKLAMLSLFDGQPVTEPPTRVISVTPEAIGFSQGRAIVAGPSGVMAFDAVSGSTLWTRRYTDTRLMGRLAMAGEMVAVESTDGMVRLLHAGQGGKEISSVLVRGGSDPMEVEMQGIGDRIYVHASRGLFVLGERPESNWQDAITLDRRQPRRVVVGQDRLALIVYQAQEGPARAPGEGAVPVSYSLFILERQGGRVLNEYTLGPLAVGTQTRRAQVFGQGLAIPVGEKTLVFPTAR